MADMALKVAAAPAADAALIQAGALLLLIVFALKAALLPLYFWLPSAYAAAPAPVAALFAIMTKVGVYAILRVYTLVFGPDAGVAAEVAQPWLLPTALLTIAVAAIGALASQSLRGMTGYLTIASVGTIILGAALGGEGAVSAALYYLVHSTLAVALMFLVADMLVLWRGDRHGGRAAPVRFHRQAVAAARCAGASRRCLELGGRARFGAGDAADAGPGRQQGVLACR
jgi:multicomponent K+:H+ antiporter subunit D